MVLSFAPLEASLLIKIGIIIVLATLFGYLFRLLKQPLIPGYILTGVLLGPLVLGFFHDIEVIKSLSEFGIAFLLFLVGLEISLTKIKHVGWVAIFGSIIQVVSIFVVSYYVSLYLGFNIFEAFILGAILSFSSTMLVVQMLSDPDKLQTLNGRIALGFLLMQDIIVILLLTVMSSFNSSSPIFLIYAVIKGLVLIWVGFLCSKFIFPALFKFAVRSQELLFLTSVAILFLFALLSELFDYSIAIGAFIAGLSLANLPYSIDIIGRVRPLKDFFATIFFVALGMQLTLPSSWFVLKALAIFLFIIFILKPFIIFLITLLFGYGSRVSFLSGISLSQISEFSLILIALPTVILDISPDVFSMVIFMTLFTMALSAYFIKYDETLYLWFSPLLKWLDTVFKKRQKLEYQSENKKEVMLIGIHRMGSIFYHKLSRLTSNMVVIDHNPEVIKELIKRRISCIYGDIANREIMEKVNMKALKYIISTVPHEEDSIFLINYAKLLNPKIKIFVTANHLHEAFKLYHAGADYVILPHILSGERMAHLLREIMAGKKSVIALKQEHLKHLNELGLFKI